MLTYLRRRIMNGFIYSSNFDLIGGQNQSGGSLLRFALIFFLMFLDGAWQCLQGFITVIKFNCSIMMNISVVRYHKHWTCIDKHTQQDK